MKTHMLVLEVTLVYGAALMATPALAKPAKHQSSAPQVVCNMYSCHPIKKASSSKKGTKTHSRTTDRGQRQPPRHE